MDIVIPIDGDGSIDIDLGVLDEDQIIKSEAVITSENVESGDEIRIEISDYNNTIDRDNITIK